MEDTAEWQDRRLVTVVATLVDEAWSVIEPNLTGLTDDDYHWEPEPGAWAVRRADQVRTADAWGRGTWRVEVDFEDHAPPMATIGWRLMHAYDCTSDYVSKAFGHGGRDWNDIEVAGGADEGVAMMTAAIDQLRRELAGADDTVFLGAVDDPGDRPRWHLLDKALIEAIHHCAEIGVLRSVRPADRP